MSSKFPQQPFTSISKNIDRSWTINTFFKISLILSSYLKFHTLADRAHRIGQASAVNVYFLHVKGSVDEIIWSALQNKLENVAQALDGCERNMDVRKSRIMPEKGQRSLASFLTPVGEESSQVAAENEDKTDADCISLHDEPDATNLRTDDPEKVRKNDRDLHHEEEIRKRTILSPPRILLGRPQVEARLSPVRETESKRSRLLG